MNELAIWSEAAFILKIVTKTKQVFQTCLWWYFMDKSAIFSGTGAADEILAEADCQGHQLIAIIKHVYCINGIQWADHRLPKIPNSFVTAAD